jgi:hypothetical protein
MICRPEFQKYDLKKLANGKPGMRQFEALNKLKGKPPLGVSIKRSAKSFSNAVTDKKGNAEQK